MPAARARGGGGTPLYNGKLYVAGGLQDDASGTGHDGVSLNLFDVYDPAPGTWTPLPNMPRPRDHFHAAVVGDKFYAIAGRQGAIPDFFNAVIPAVDVYDFTSRDMVDAAGSVEHADASRSSRRRGPRQRDHRHRRRGQRQAWNTVEAFDTTTGTWRTLPPMPTARHGIQAAVCNGGIYIAAGRSRRAATASPTCTRCSSSGAPTPCGPGPPPPSSALPRQRRRTDRVGTPHGARTL